MCEYIPPLFANNTRVVYSSQAVSLIIVDIFKTNNKQNIIYIYLQIDIFGVFDLLGFGIFILYPEMSLYNIVLSTQFYFI